MRRMVVVVMWLVAGTAQAAQTSCEDLLAHVLNFGVPRTSLDAEAANLPETLAGLVQPLYKDPCNKGKKLQINLTFGSDYEVLDWIERGSVDGGVVPALSLWLLERETPLRELSAAKASDLRILHPRLPAPTCTRMLGGTSSACDPNATYAALLADLAAGKSAGTRRVMFASHLSSTGFLAPLAQAATVLKTDAQWEALFAIAHFTIDTSPAEPDELFQLAVNEEPTPPADLTVIQFPGEEVIARGEVISDVPDAYREHLVVSASAADFFKPEAFACKREKPLLPQALQALLIRKHPPRPLEVIVQADPASGVRKYSFTINESMRLLAQQQRSSGESELALVLPGGGVKAAYQSKIVDHLYEKHLLRNAGLPARKGSLAVRSVLGTSGGALLGYFVSQLGESGPFNLSDILWKPGGKLLDAHNVFNALDMLRYTSVVWTFAIFAVLLALITGTSSSKFYGRSPTPHGSWRWRLMTLLFVFLAVPLLVRYVTGGDEMEHVPVIEGIFYVMVTIVVMFCDQCLIHSEDETETRPLRDHVIILAGIGGLFVLVAVAAKDQLQGAVTIGFAFATLAVIFLGGPLLLLYVNDRFGDSQRRLGDTLGSLVTVMILCALGVPGWVPMQIRALAAMLLLLGLALIAYWHAHLPERRPIVGTALTFFTLLAVAILCWPEEAPARGLAFITTPAMEQTNLGPFLTSTGCLLLVIAAMVWVYQRREYSIRNEQDFSLGLALLVVHALATGMMVTLLARFWPKVVQNIEVTSSFWIATTLIGGVLALILLFSAQRWPLSRRAVGFLTAEHPNGSLLPRRYARMLAVAVVSLIWWNSMMAPALYGNDTALKYLQTAVKNFDLARPGPDGFLPTAKFVAPTNMLEDVDSTRYFVFLTRNDRGLALPRSQWKVYKVTEGSVTETEKSQNVRPLHPRDSAFVRDVIFSSGSPFPILAAHRVTTPGEGAKLDLIDGGYSNDIPIGAARKIMARQALVIHSAPAAEAHEHTEQARSLFSLSVSPGMLIRNAQRLPSFMFEHGQQADRLSRQNLFVIGLAPLLNADDTWPGLAQFDRTTVQAMLEKGEANLYERIGIAESWGEPRFRFSQQIEQKSESGAPATTADPG